MHQAFGGPRHRTGGPLFSTQILTQIFKFLIDLFGSVWIIRKNRKLAV
nr:MAG TPA: hypothetical protein [Caudoviricetes sp.]